MKKKIVALVMSGLMLAGGAKNFCVSAVSEEIIIADLTRTKTLEDLLFSSILKADVKAVNMFLEKGVDPNCCDWQNGYPLYDAVLIGNYPSEIEASRKICDLLLAKGADPTLKNDKDLSTLDLFGMADRSYLDDIFAKYGYDVACKVQNSETEEPVFWGRVFYDSETIEPVNLEDLLCEYVNEVDFGAVNTILELGADPNKLSSTGESALTVARSIEVDDFKKQLLEEIQLLLLGN